MSRRLWVTRGNDDCDCDLPQNLKLRTVKVRMGLARRKLCGSAKENTGVVQ